MLRLRYLCAFRREQSCVPRKQMLETQIGQKMPRLASHTVVVLRPITSEVEFLGVLFPTRRLHLSNPQVPSRGNLVTHIAGLMFPGQPRDFRRSDNLPPQIKFLDGSFSEIHSADCQFRETHRPRGQWHSRQKMLEMGEHIRLVEIVNPDAGVGAIRHPGIIQGSLQRTESLRAPKQTLLRIFRFLFKWIWGVEREG